jgi:hypothetical protein
MPSFPIRSTLQTPPNPKRPGADILKSEVLRDIEVESPRQRQRLAPPLEVESIEKLPDRKGNVEPPTHNLSTD